MGRFVAEAPQSVLACSAVGARINLQQWDDAGPFTGMRDGNVLDLGRHRTTASLFASDLFIQPNDQPTIVRENLGTDMCEWYRAAGLFGGADPVLRVVARIERLAPAWVHPMHGGSLPADTLQGYTAALRTQPFTFDGRLFGRHLPNGA